MIRARRRCEMCGALDRWFHPVTGRVVQLAAAHVHDPRPESAGLLNLKALCQRCHTALDQDVRRARAQERREQVCGQLRLFDDVSGVLRDTRNSGTL